MALGGLLIAALPASDPADAKSIDLGTVQIQACGLWLAGFLVLLVLGDYFFKKRPDEVSGERDQQISQNSATVATSVSWIGFGVVCAAWF